MMPPIKMPATFRIVPIIGGKDKFAGAGSKFKVHIVGLRPGEQGYTHWRLVMPQTIKIGLVGAGMFGGEVHARAYADLQRAGISSQLGRVGLDQWAADFAPIKFELAAIATRTEKSA